jgi:hypothetical protein
MGGSMPERPLVLHISALSPDEYDLFINVLAELAGPGQDTSIGQDGIPSSHVVYNTAETWNRPVDIMEARGWIRGRYGLEVAVVDKVWLTFGLISSNYPQSN